MLVRTVEPGQGFAFGRWSVWLDRMDTSHRGNRLAVLRVDGPSGLQQVAVGGEGLLTLETEVVIGLWGIRPHSVTLGIEAPRDQAIRRITVPSCCPGA